MHIRQVKEALRFYFVTDEAGSDVLGQVRTALTGGATCVQYRSKHFALSDMPAVAAAAALCRANRVPFLVNDDILLARAVGADGVHLGQDDCPPALARQILGDAALVGTSISNLEELARTDLSPCDYIGTGPVYATGTKADAKAVIGLDGLAAVIARAPRPVVAIGGIGIDTAAACLQHGAAGVAVISAVTRAPDPAAAARALARACGLSPRPALRIPWQDEFDLIEKILAAGSAPDTLRVLVEPPGDDTCRMRPLARPVITTDTHRERVHFRRDWQTLSEIGFKAVAVTLSDLAAACAVPRAIFANLTLPSDATETDAVDLYRGIGAALSQYGAVLGGGNVSRGRALALDLFAVGEGRPEYFPTRRAARPGDQLYATGPLGLARAGLHCLRAGDDRFADLVAAFKRPRARFDAAAVLAAAGIDCVMDISDGLVGDAGHIADASNVSIALAIAPVALHPSLVNFCDRYGFDPAPFAMAGGEDYELLFACRPEVFARIATKLTGAVAVGRCLPRAATALVDLPTGVASFQHGLGSS